MTQEDVEELLVLDGGDVGMSRDRFAYLAPKLRTLIQDFRALESLEADAAEPGISPWRCGDDANVQQ
jgi:hypothetical protein